MDCRTLLTKKTASFIPSVSHQHQFFHNCYDFPLGNNYESTFEAEILDSTRHCQIWGYDYRTKSLGPDIPKAHLGRTHFRRFGLAGTDKHGPSDRPHMYTLESLIKLNGEHCCSSASFMTSPFSSGHSHIDILKVDAEGLEFEALTTAIKPYLESGGALPFGQLLIEIHLWGKSFAEFLSWWESLEAAGLRPFWGEVIAFTPITFEIYFSFVSLSSAEPRLSEL